ncbi:hypothetical protein PHYBLDRAFT_73284 [Phycomyces blakesleeanus NRRL 1555(-)]|uniref:Ndc10 domain-containing protein n=1 Tax=Phycomyces blakesleeanus (strain ATCC 8743b / DSM 1359 / FGSC 10004 / NBRC 33097 / NRRL 1555) TaxID=763407 RepID=A0A162ZLC2_PHYB8|nr:hypothetical protein PHYBLDRAFT_73284 [Phycomyces blakesleeanus NRRL 1555(-)]OAD67591.1 hypothetical protein PHYBLDRAFT_73284 [Phycomyces blakesleeanus NRRL 1555(-)]|eukprot:XP_018285631.1 hypothetical protein PHYBLDRAFT_73284 [Phycomyces blakesleeanus NRRL 1555(-)]
MTGFPSAEGQFYLPRPQVKPAKLLQCKVFPMVDFWYDRILSGVCQQTAAAHGFLELLKQLRITFLQNSVSVKAFVDTDVKSTDILLQRALPLIARKLADMQNVDSGFCREVLREFGVLHQKIDDLTNNDQQFFNRHKRIFDHIKKNMVDNSLMLILISLGKTNLLSHLSPLKLQSPSAVKNHFESIREAGFTTFLQSNTQVLIHACRPVLGVDPILFLPASCVERGHLIRWRMGWLPDKPKKYPCGSDHTSRRHLLNCPLVPATLFEQLPQPDHDQIHRIDFAMTFLPLSSQEPRPAY